MNGATLSYARNSQATRDPFIGLSQLPGNGEQIAGNIETSLFRMLDQWELVTSGNWLILPPLVGAQCVESGQSVKAAQPTPHQAAIQLLESWRHGDEQEQRETWDCLQQALGGKAARLARREAARILLQEWLADESGYDEQTWPIVKKAIEENRPSYRSRLGE